jgi:DNA primase small subunit
MENKDRQSTDLVFDIDDRDNMVWAIAKTKMLYRLLTEDFGFSQILMNFSGSKGFHVRVYDMEIQRLDAEERREIVDYIELIGVEAEGDLFAVEQSGKEFKINFKNTPIDPGRRSWVFRTFQEEVNAIEKMDDAGRAKFMESFGKKASRPFNNAIKSGAMSQGINRGYLWIKSYYPEMWGSLFKMLMEKSRPHIDVPVTVDLHRLIRFPGTLHGGTGFRAKVLDMDQLEKFNPFRDAIAFGETPTRAQVKNNIQLPQLELKLPKGDHVVPEYVAVYLACKDQAEIIPMQ